VRRYCVTVSAFVAKQKRRTNTPGLSERDPRNNPRGTRTRSGSLNKIIATWVGRAQLWEMTRTPQRADADHRRKRSQDSERLSLFITLEPTERDDRPGHSKPQDSPRLPKTPKSTTKIPRQGGVGLESVLAISHWWMFAAADWSASLLRAQ
jgi:hypothetical protein